VNGSIIYNYQIAYYLKKLILIPLLLFTQLILSQTVYHHISNHAVYDFLDEMAGEGYIEINSAVLPFSRAFIAHRLLEIDAVRVQLNSRQVKELDFYLKDFNKELRNSRDYEKRFDLLHYKDSLFTISANLILGYQYWTNQNGEVYHRWNGGEIQSYVGEHWGFYASLRDNHESKPISDSPYLNQRMGGNYKAAYDYSEMRGGITYSWKWGNIGLVKDHHIWGNNYNGSNIQSGRTPSFAKIQLNLNPVKWFEFNYFHGWLVSEEIDSARSYWINTNLGSTYRNVYHPKYIAANMFTFQPVRKLYVSAGNSIIYADIGVHPAYLIPVFFYKSVDHTINSRINNQNSQMFLDISSRNFHKLHLYGSMFVDELALSRMTKEDEHSNFWSWKLGGRTSNMIIDNLSLGFEFTRSNSLTFRHPEPTITYESNGYNIGHYLTDNAVEYYLEGSYKPFAKFRIKASYSLSRKGPDYTEAGGSRLGLPYMEEIVWEARNIAFHMNYQIINDLFVFINYRNSDISGDLDKYTHPLWHGNNNSLSLGVNFGF